MAADVDHSEELNKLAAQHQKRLAEALAVLEARIVDLLSTAPMDNGELFDLEWAIAARPQIRQLVEEEYLSTVDEIIRGYPAVAAQATAMLSTYGSFTRLDPRIINQLQNLTYQGFADIGNEYIDVISKEVYQNTLTGRAFSESVDTIKEVANGRLARYANQQMHDTLMQFDASINVAIGKAAGATKWRYVGRLVETSRPFCRDHEGEVMTNEKIEELWSGDWAGKAAGDPFIVRGGYNCGHRFRPVFIEEE